MGFSAWANATVTAMALKKTWQNRRIISPKPPLLVLPMQQTTSLN